MTMEVLKERVEKLSHREVLNVQPRKVLRVIKLLWYHKPGFAAEETYSLCRAVEVPNFCLMTKDIIEQE